MQLINAKKCNLKCSITGISFYHSFVTSCSVTSDRHWPSGTQEEVFESVRTFHSRVLCLQIKRGGGVFVNSDQSASKYTCGSVRISESWVHSTPGILHTVHPSTIMQEQASPITYWFAKRSFVIHGNFPSPAARVKPVHTGCPAHTLLWHQEV